LKKKGISTNPSDFKEIKIQISNSMLLNHDFEDIDKLVEELIPIIQDQVRIWILKMMMKS